jgi:choline-sulfatase
MYAPRVTVETPGYRPYLLAGVSDDSAGPVHHPAFDKGIDFVRRRAGGDKPFCCFVSASEPHDPYLPPTSFLDMYDVDSVRVSPTLREEDDGTKPELLRRMRAVWRGLSDADWRMISAAYWAVISFLDSETGRILEALREAGCSEDTVVIVTSDHGDMLGGHGLATKGIGTAYEEVYNVPLILRVPGFRAGEDTSHTVSLVDIAPTILDLCGAEPLADCQGRSMRTVLDGTSDGGDWQDAYAEFFGQRFVYTQRICWHGDGKYVFSPGGIDELYNLAEDPWEEHNRAADPGHRPVLEDMCRRMWRKMKEIGDDSLFNTHYATLRTAPIGPRSVREDEGG